MASMELKMYHGTTISNARSVHRARGVTPIYLRDARAWSVPLAVSCDRSKAEQYRDGTLLKCGVSIFRVKGTIMYTGKPQRLLPYGVFKGTTAGGSSMACTLVERGYAQELKFSKLKFSKPNPSLGKI